jgi:hypothetical protein
MPPDGILHIVEFGEVRRNTGFDRPLAEQLCTEGVDSSCEHALHIGLSLPKPQRCLTGFSLELPFELNTATPDQFGGRFAREGDCRDLLDAAHARGNHRRDPPCGATRFSRAGTCLDKHVDVKSPDDGVPSRPVFELNAPRHGQ